MSRFLIVVERPWTADFHFPWRFRQLRVTWCSNSHAFRPQSTRSWWTGNALSESSDVMYAKIQKTLFPWNPEAAANGQRPETVQPIPEMLSVWNQYWTELESAQTTFSAEASDRVA